MVHLGVVYHAGCELVQSADTVLTGRRPDVDEGLMGVALAVVEQVPLQYFDSERLGSQCDLSGPVRSSVCRDERTRRSDDALTNC